LVAALSAPIVVKGRPIRLTASVGLAAVDELADFDELMARAGTAMEAAKAVGGDCYQRYQPEHGGPWAHMEFATPAVPDRLASVMLLERAAVAANECSSLEEAAAIVLRQVITHTGWRAGHLWLVDRVGARLKPSGVWHVSGPDALKEFRLHTERVTLEGRAELAALVVASGRPQWAAFGGDRGAAGAGCAGDDAAARAAGLVAAAAFPVLAGSEVVAVLGFYATGPIAPDDSLIDVMAGVGAQLGRISERTRAADQLARSEERYRTLADTLPSLIWMAGADVNCTFVNRRWLEFTGRSLEQELGHGWVEAVHPDDVVRCIQTFINAFDRREPIELELRKRRADGEYRWLLTRGGPMFDHGEFVGYVGTSIDISDRHQAQVDLRDEEVRFRTLVGSSDVMIVVLAADGTLIDEFLPATGLGYQAGEGLGRLGFDYLHPDDLERAATEFAAALAHPGRSRSFECRVRHADGSWRWLRAMPNNMLADPRVRGLVVTATDITDTKALLERLRVAEERLRQADGPLPRPPIAVRSRH
jgi:PAS domain S-box-containing protein